MQIQNHLQSIDLNEWSVYDVASWLSFNNIPKGVINYFIGAEIDGSVLKELGSSAIKEIEIIIPDSLIKLHSLVSSLIQYSRNKSLIVENLSSTEVFPISAVQKNLLLSEASKVNQVLPTNYLEIKSSDCTPVNMRFYNQLAQYSQNKPAIHENVISGRSGSSFSAYENELQKLQLLNRTQLTMLADSSNNQTFQHLEETVPISYISNIHPIYFNQMFYTFSQNIQNLSALRASLSIKNNQQQHIQGNKLVNLLLPSLSNNKLQHMNQDIRKFQISEMNKLLISFHETWKHFLCPSLKKKASDIYKYCKGKEIKVNDSICHLLNNTIIPIVSLLSQFSLEDEDFDLVIKKLDQSICRYRVLIWIKDLFSTSESDLLEPLSIKNQSLPSMNDNSCDSDCIWSQSNIEELISIPLVHISQHVSFKKILEKCQAKTPDLQLDSPDVVASIVNYLKNNNVYFQNDKSSQLSKHCQSDKNISEICTSHKHEEYFNSNNSDLLLNNQLYQENIPRAELSYESLIKTDKFKDEELTEYSKQYPSIISMNTDIKTLKNFYQDSHFSSTPRQLSSSICSSETSSSSTQSSTGESTTMTLLTSESSSESYRADYFSTASKRTPSETSESSSASSFSNNLIFKRKRKLIDPYEYPRSENIDYSYESQKIQNSNNSSKVHYKDSRSSHCLVGRIKNRKDGYYWNESHRVSNQAYMPRAQSNQLIKNTPSGSNTYGKSTCERINLPSLSFNEISITQKSSLPGQHIAHSEYNSAEELDPGLIRVDNQLFPPFSNYSNTPISIKALYLNLKPHQVSGIEFLWKTVVEKGHGAILAHAMGLGKTGQVFTFLNTLNYYIQNNRNIISNNLHQFKVLILAPASLQENWINEFQKWTNFEDSSTSSFVYLPMPISLGETPTRQRIRKLKYWAKNGGILILSHTLFKNCVQNKDRHKNIFEDILVNQPGASLVVIDEAHVLKKENTLIRKISKEFKTPARIMLTGYPMQNSLTEYWCMSKFANDSIFGSLHNFKIEYKYPINNGFYEPLGSRLRKESDKILYKLSKLLQPIVHRVNSDVIKDQIPKKVEYAVCCYLSPIQYTLYTYYVDLFNNELSKAEFLEKGCLLQTICNIPIHKDLIFSSNTSEKVDVIDEDSELESSGSMHMKILLERMKDLSFNSSDIKNNPKFFILTELIQESLLVDEKLIVFSRNIKTLLAIQKWLELFISQKTLLLTGETIMEDRQYYVNCINEDDEYRILLASVNVGGVGFTVTGATRVIIYDLGYNPTVIDQAIARTFRIGQTKNVHVYRLYTFDTWEDKLNTLSEHKNNLILRTMDSRNSDVDSVNLKEMKMYFKVPEYRFNGERKIYGEDFILGKILNKYKDFIASCVIHRDEPTEHTFDINETEKRAIEIEVEFAMETLDIFNE